MERMLAFIALPVGACAFGQKRGRVCQNAHAPASPLGPFWSCTCLSSGTYPLVGAHVISWRLLQAKKLDTLPLEEWWRHTSEEMPSRPLEMDTFLFPLCFVTAFYLEKKKR